MEKEVRLIDADKLKNHYAWWENGTAEMTLAEAKKNFDVIIDVQPTVEQPQTNATENVTERHGHWIFNPKDAIEMMFTLPKCSECGAESSDGGNYCPNCGAKMDEVEDAKEE